MTEYRVVFQFGRWAVERRQGSEWITVNTYLTYDQAIYDLYYLSGACAPIVVATVTAP